MDLKAVLQGEIDKKRKLYSSAASSKYVKLGDLNKPQEINTPVPAPAVKKVIVQEVKKEQEMVLPSPEELTKRLRSKNQPKMLFGENEKQRFKRLKFFEAREEVFGEQNEFMKTMSHTAEIAQLEALKKEKGQETNLKGQLEMLTRITTGEQVNLDLLMGDPARARFLIGLYFKRLLMEWKCELDERSEQEKLTQEGLFVTATYQQTVEYTTAFFERLKNNEFTSDVMSHLTEMVEYLQKKEYIPVHDAYIRLSIGNAPWPIGVTAVGIHERTARDKIQNSQIARKFARFIVIADVLNDEAQRKWIQGLKRLISFQQNKYPPADPSRKVG